MIFTFEEFIEEVANRIRKEVCQQTKVTLCNTKKNNGVIKHGICITQYPKNISPTIYLDDYYEKYLCCRNIEEIVSEIMKLYGEAKNRTPEIGWMFESFDYLRPKIVARLINWEYNQELLDTIPHVRFLNLAVAFYVIVDVNSFSNASMLITNEHCSIWQTDEEELLDVAIVNTQKLLGFSFTPVEHVLEDLSEMRCPLEETLYVFSNKERNYGSAVMLYYEKLEEIARAFKESFYILPCSIHELIIVRESQAMEVEEMIMMVREINKESVLEEEVLSDTVYYYDHDEKKLVVRS